MFLLSLMKTATSRHRTNMTGLVDLALAVDDSCFLNVFLQLCGCQACSSLTQSLTKQNEENILVFCVSLGMLNAENYERLEADKKKQVHKKHQCVGPVIRYHSVLMPLVSDPSFKEENVDVEGYGFVTAYLIAALLLEGFLTATNR